MPTNYSGGEDVYCGHDGDDLPVGQTDGRTGKGGNSIGTPVGRNWRRAVLMSQITDDYQPALGVNV